MLAGGRRWRWLSRLAVALLMAVSVLAGSAVFSPSAPVGIDLAIASLNAQQDSSPEGAKKKTASKAKQTSKDTESESEESEEEEDDGKAGPPSLGALFPVGRAFRGVKIPSYAGDILNSIVVAQTMVRVDEEHLEMRQLEITLFGRSSAEQDTTITTDLGVYDLNNETLTSRSKAFIERDNEFTMVGDRMIFNGKTQEGRLVGNVKMRIIKIGETFGKP